MLDTSIRIVFFLILIIMPLLVWTNPYTVIKSRMEIEGIDFISTGPNTPPVKLKCHDSKTPNIADFIWEYIRCGDALSLSHCSEFNSEKDWRTHLCKNHSKPCMSSTLTIRQPTESDSGLYRCLEKNYMVNNHRYTINRVFQLNIREMQSRTLEILNEAAHDDNKTVLENSTAVFRCRVRSVYPPSIVWLREIEKPQESVENKIVIHLGKYYEAINGTYLHSGHGKLYTMKLHLKHVKTSDSGTYVCYACNVYTLNYNQTKRVKLRVIPLIDKNQKAEFIENSSETWMIALIPAFVILLIAIIGAGILCCFNRTEKRILISTCEESSSFQCLN